MDEFALNIKKMNLKEFSVCGSQVQLSSVLSLKSQISAI